MFHVMFDVDGTLANSYEFDEACFIDSVKEVTGLDINSDWSTYPHVTDTGILQTFVERQAPDNSLDELQSKVKKSFVGKIKKHLESNKAEEIIGAKTFFKYVVNKPQFIVSIATGGWRETAELKLQSAGFDIRGVEITSSNDHFSRSEIMRISRSKAALQPDHPITYFGDAEWDLNACNNLDINLVIVGNRVQHSQMIPDYSDLSLALHYLNASK